MVVEKRWVSVPCKAWKEPRSKVEAGKPGQTGVPWPQVWLRS